MNYQAVLFDFDYTLGDSTVPIVMGYQRSMEQMGWPAPTAEQVKPTIGFTLMDGYTMLTGDKDAQRRQEFYRRFQENVGEKALERGERAMVERTRLFPGTAELLTALGEAGVHTGIVSTKLGSTIVQIFRFNGCSGPSPTPRASTAPWRGWASGRRRSSSAGTPPSTPAPPRPRAPTSARCSTASPRQRTLPPCPTSILPPTWGSSGPGWGCKQERSIRLPAQMPGGGCFLYPAPGFRREIDGAAGEMIE